MIQSHNCSLSSEAFGRRLEMLVRIKSVEQLREHFETFSRGYQDADLQREMEDLVGSYEGKVDKQWLASILWFMVVEHGFLSNHESMYSKLVNAISLGDESSQELLGAYGGKEQAFRSKLRCELEQEVRRRFSD